MAQFELSAESLGLAVEDLWAINALPLPSWLDSPSIKPE